MPGTESYIVHSSHFVPDRRLPDRGLPEYVYLFDSNSAVNSCSSLHVANATRESRVIKTSDSTTTCQLIHIPEAQRPE